MKTKKIISVSLCFILVISLLSGGLTADCAFADTRADALYEEGMKYFSGNGVPQDLEKGSGMILEAANGGSVNAMLQVAFLSAYGLGALFTDDYQDGMDPIYALDWFSKAAESGEKEVAARAIVETGYDYLLGRNEQIEENPVAAVMFFEKAEELGYYEGNNTLGIFYTYGAVVDRDSNRALDLFVEGARAGFSDCEYSIEEYAYAYYAGTDEEIDINFATAFQYYEALTEFGNTRAMYNLGLLYNYGLGVARDSNKGGEWIQKAADLGDGVAAELLKRQISTN